VAGALRALVRFPLLFLVSLGFFLLWLAGAGILFAAAGPRVRFRRWILRSWGSVFLAVVGARVEVIGKPPEPPFVLVANHLGYLDIPLLASRAGGVFVAKREIAGWPLIGLLVRGVGTVFVDRGLRRDIPRALGKIEKVLDEGDGVILFPEGTSTPGDEVAPFRPSLLEAPARGGLAVSYAALSYRTAEGDPPAREVVCWWGGMTFLDHVWRLATLRGIEASLAFGDHTLREADRKLLAGRLHLGVSDLFEPVGTD